MSSLPGPELSWMFVLLLAVQTVTFAAAIASILVFKKALPLVPVLGCSAVTGLMLYLGDRLSDKTNLAPNPYLVGYWLTYPSLFVFLLVFVLSMVAIRENGETALAPAHT